jgi:hypothetical protein
VLAHPARKSNRIVTLRAVLGACAQWEINQPSCLRKRTSELGGIIISPGEYMIARPDPSFVGISLRRLCSACLILTGLLAISCALSPSPRQMYEGAPLPKEQVGIVRSGCVAGPGLKIMATQIDGKEISDVCADFALLPGEHQIELSAEQLVPKLETGMLRSGSVLGAPPFPMSVQPDQTSQVVWASQSPLRITCSLRAGEEVTIVGTRGMGQEWEARCQER